MSSTNIRSWSLEDVLDIAFFRQLMALYCSMPGIIVDYDASTQTATVQPVLRKPVVQPNGVDAVPQLAVLRSVPVVFPGSGAWRMTMPVSAGDHVLLVFSDRSLDLWKSTGAEGDPLAAGAHKIADAIAFVGLVPPAKSRTAPASDRISMGSDGGAVVDVTSDEVLLGSSTASEAFVKGTAFTQHLTSAFIPALNALGASLTPLMLPPAVAAAQTAIAALVAATNLLVADISTTVFGE